MSSKIYLLTGVNLGDKMAQLQKAKAQLSNAFTLSKASAIYETAAWGKTEQDSFYNQCLCYQTTHSPTEVLASIQQIENNLGRVRFEKWGARLIDIDILFFDQQIVETEELKIPHPYLEQRKFALEPLAEIAPNLQHPVHGKSVQQMLSDCSDQLSVNKLSAFEAGL